ncbi:MAG: tetratricopeptide repeat protein [Thiomicrorhabdus sp.]|nr:tetratricopeptide repeat protein [Thiomicrorhabdus sp.]
MLSSFFKTSIAAFLLLSALTLSQNSYAKQDPYVEALLLFKAQKYAQAYEQFSQLVQSDLSSYNYNFYLARSATLLNKFDEAISIYERILILYPNNTRSKLELGRLHFAQQSYALSKSYFEDALNDNVPKNVQKNIYRYLNKMNQQEKRSSWSATFIAGLGHDSNVNTTPDANAWFVPAFGTELDNADEVIENNFHQETLALKHRNHSREKYGFDIENELLLYSKSLMGESDYNIIFGQYKPTLIFPIGKHNLRTSLEYNYLHYGGEPYVESYGVSPNLQFNSASNQQITAKIKVLKKHYLQEEYKDKDAILSELSAQLVHRVNSNLTLRLHSALLNEQKVKGNLYDVDLNSFSVLFAANYRITNDWTIGGNINLRQISYLDKNPFFLDKREDVNKSLTLNLTKVLNKQFALQASYQRIFNQSNQEPYEYQKDLASINLITNFNGD